MCHIQDGIQPIQFNMPVNSANVPVHIKLGNWIVMMLLDTKVLGGSLLANNPHLSLVRFNKTGNQDLVQQPVSKCAKDALTSMAAKGLTSSLQFESVCIGGVQVKEIEPPASRHALNRALIHETKSFDDLSAHFERYCTNGKVGSGCRINPT